MEYRIAVQCWDTVSGLTGTFIRDEYKNAVSPIFKDLAELFPWMRQNGWKRAESTGPDGTVFIPWRVEKIG